MIYNKYVIQVSLASVKLIGNENLSMDAMDFLYVGLIIYAFYLIRNCYLLNWALAVPLAKQDLTCSRMCIYFKQCNIQL